MRVLFGSNYQQLAEGYGARGSDTEIREAAANAWAELKVRYGLDTASKEADSASYLSRKVTEKVVAMWDNASDINTIVAQYMEGVKQSARTRADAEAAEAKRLADAKAAAEEAAKNAELKADPNYKEIPADLAAKFRDLGITVKLNTLPVSLRGMKGSGDAFCRYFFQDSEGKSGRLYRFKEIMKARFNASFTDAWREQCGAWWHLDSKADLNEIYNILA